MSIESTCVEISKVKPSMELLNASCFTHEFRTVLLCISFVANSTLFPGLNQHGDHGKCNMSVLKENGSHVVSACQFDVVMGDVPCFYASSRASRLSCCHTDTGQLQLQAISGYPWPQR